MSGILHDLERRQRAMRRVRFLLTYVLVGLGVWSVGEIHLLTKYAREWSGSLQNLVMVEKVFSDLKDMESGQRGYIITDDEDYLAQYNSGHAALSYDLKVLEAYLGASPLQRAPMREMGLVIGAKTEEMQRAVNMFRSQGFPAAQAIIRTNRGAQQMKHIRFLMDVIRAREQASIKESGLGL